MESLVLQKVGMDDFNTVFEQYQQKYEEFIGIFKGSADENGVNWCKDCVVADGPIKEILHPLAASKNIPILEVSVGFREELNKEIK